MQKSMNNQGIVDEDRISELPDVLLVQILSLLPTEEAVSASVLSKQWQSLWKLLPKLKFDTCTSYYRSEHGKFSKNVCKALLSHKAPVLQNLHLKIHLERCNPMDTGKLIEIAFVCNVRELVLYVNGTGKRYIFPKSFYNCEILETLELSSSVLMDVPSSVSLNSLRTLYLFYVEFEDDEPFLNFLSGCPKLENLVVHGLLFPSVKTVAIAVPSLRRLSIFNFRGDHKITRTCWVINAPSLKYLKIGGVKVLDSCLIVNVPELVEANLINDDSADKIINEKLMGYLTSVKRLSLSLSPFKNMFPTGIIFHQLLYLELHTYKFEWGKLLTRMLDSSPKLQVLKLIGNLRSGIDFLACWKWNQPKTVPECLLFHLEIFTFMWEYYTLIREDEIEWVKYILSKANRLKRASFSSKHITHKERVEMLEKLESVARASDSCQIVFK